MRMQMTSMEAKEYLAQFEDDADDILNQIAEWKCVLSSGHDQNVCPTTGDSFWNAEYWGEEDSPTRSSGFKARGTKLSGRASLRPQQSMNTGTVRKSVGGVGGKKGRKSKKSINASRFSSAARLSRAGSRKSVGRKSVGRKSVGRRSIKSRKSFGTMSQTSRGSRKSTRSRGRKSGRKSLKSRKSFGTMSQTSRGSRKSTRSRKSGKMSAKRKSRRSVSRKSVSKSIGGESNASGKSNVSRKSTRSRRSGKMKRKSRKSVSKSLGGESNASGKSNASRVSRKSTRSRKSGKMSAKRRSTAGKRRSTAGSQKKSLKKKKQSVKASGAVKISVRGGEGGADNSFWGSEGWGDEWGDEWDSATAGELADALFTALAESEYPESAAQDGVKDSLRPESADGAPEQTRRGSASVATGAPQEDSTEGRKSKKPARAGFFAAMLRGKILPP